MRNVYDFYITPEEYKRAAENGIRKAALEARIRKPGWDKERAINEPTQKREDRSKWCQIAIENGISKGTFMSRVNACKWSKEKAATIPVQNKGKIRRKYPDELYSVLKQNEINVQAFHKRIKRGWTIERAMTEKINSKQEIIMKMCDKSKNLNTAFKEANKSYWMLRNDNKINI